MPAARPRPFAPRLALAGAALLVTAWCAAPAHAEEIVLRNGKTREGRIVVRDEHYVVLETALGRIRIALADIETIRTDDGKDEKVDAARPPETDDGVRHAGDDSERPTPLPADADAAGAGGTGGADAEAAEERLRRLRQSRVVRRTSSGDDEQPVATTDTPAPPETSIGGRDLVKVPKGTDLIVYEPPKPFAGAPGAIEIGRRTFAKLEMVGSASAWLAVPAAAGTERVPMRLADVKRHLEVKSPDARLRIFEGINAGDWLRVRCADGSEVCGRLAGFDATSVKLVGYGERGVETPHSVAASDVVRVDGLIRDSAARLALTELVDGEPLAITFWPQGDQLFGRYVKSGADTLGLDLDGDGAADQVVARSGPLAEVRRAPPRFRDLSVHLRAGDVVRVAYREDFEAASVKRTTVGRIMALTAFALSLETEDGASVVPFEGVQELVLIEVDADDELARWHTPLDPLQYRGDLPVLPGDDVQIARELDASCGISTLNDGRTVTHVFVAPPYGSEAFGVRVGEPVTQALRRSLLHFETTVTPRPRADAPREPTEIISESVKGLRVVVLADSLGAVTAVEISRTR